MKRLLLLAPLALLFAACGGGPVSDQPKGPHYVGIVTARIAPSGSHEECSMIMAVPYVEQCSTAGNYDYAVWIEPLPGHKYTFGGWYETRSLVCIAPTYWRTLRIGSKFDSSGDDDLHCDG